MRRETVVTAVDRALQSPGARKYTDNAKLLAHALEVGISKGNYSPPDMLKFVYDTVQTTRVAVAEAAAATAASIAATGRHGQVRSKPLAHAQPNHFMVGDVLERDVLSMDKGRTSLTGGRGAGGGAA